MSIGCVLWMLKFGVGVFSMSCDPLQQVKLRRRNPTGISLSTCRIWSQEV